MKLGRKFQEPNKLALSASYQVLFYGINFRISFLKIEFFLKTDKPTAVVLSNLSGPPQGVLFSLRGELDTLVTGDEA